MEQIINHLNEQNQQLETKLNILSPDIEKLHHEIELIDQKVRNAQEDVQRKENEILNLQKNERAIPKFQRENDRLNAELIRIGHLINRISLIITMKQNNNPKEFTQFKNNIVTDLQLAEKELAEIQKQTHPIIEIEQSIQNLEQTLNALVKELAEYENKLRTSNENIDQQKYVSIR